ncbi:LysM peptidoglycan-binding domain-containing protein, partial [Streptomyces sp. HSW2009]|uniref:LysM peptidoglycan-binding domain-containing protein n=1 Tax=Streptomyces sp. HSW2009 TaxID=3142890 RepID=UPI0032EE01FC
SHPLHVHRTPPPHRHGPPPPPPPPHTLFFPPPTPQTPIAGRLVGPDWCIRHRAARGRHAGGSDDAAETGAEAGADAGAGTGKHRGEPSPEPGADADRGDGATERPEGRHVDRSERGRDGVKDADGVTEGKHEVRSGDTLSAIAERHETPGGWPALYEANEKVVGADPDLILPGQKLDLGVKAER